jgi:hypothetical protein
MLTFRDYTLYKVHEDKESELFLNIVRYLHRKNNDIRPNTIIERWSDPNIKPPTIMFNKGYSITGIDNISSFFSDLFNIKYLLNESITFTKFNPEYRIADKSTHKNIIKSSSQ